MAAPLAAATLWPAAGTAAGRCRLRGHGVEGERDGVEEGMQRGFEVYLNCFCDLLEPGSESARDCAREKEEEWEAKGERGRESARGRFS